MPPRLHVVFTIDCPPASSRAEPKGPDNWEISARVIDTFCTCVLNGGFAPTLFLSPEAAEQHTPLCEELIGIGVDVGLFIQPPTLRGAKLKHYLGAYSRQEQQAIVSETLRRFEDVLGRRPVSVRSAMFSASDDTFPVLSAAGFRQASLSSPGRQLPRFRAVWTNAAREAHQTNADDRLSAGSLPLLEVPVTTDATQCKGGLAPELAIENGTLERWHQPLIAGQLERHHAEDVPFRTLCFVTTSRVAYHDTSSRFRQTLDTLLDYLRELEEKYEVVPATLAGVHTYFHETQSAGGAVA